MMYGSGTWAVKTAQENNLDVAEIRMLDGYMESQSLTKLGMKELEWQ